MGTRQLQKLQGKDLLPDLDATDSGSSSAEDDAAAAPFNPFLMLGESDEEDEPEPAAEDDSPKQSAQTDAASRGQSKSQKQKRKKKKQDKKAKERVESDPDVDIDAALKDLGLKATPSAPDPVQNNECQGFSFRINTKHLSPDEDAISVFRIEPSSRYRTATLHFKQAQASMDPNQVAGVLGVYPFHVHTVLTMSDIYQSSGQGDSAGAMLNRALYALEGSWHPRFKACMLHGTARLPAGEGENSLMYAALARRVRALCRQGMHRTALEWAKLTLRLDDTDPAGVLFLMDYLALRAREYDFIGGLMEAWDGPTSLRLVPSYMFSAALAEYYAGKAAAADDGAATATGVHEAGARPEVDVELVNALITFPLALEHLVKAMQDKDAAKSANWQSVMRRRLFAEPRGASSATLQHLCRIFAARHHELWKAPDVLAWLLRCAEAAADSADAADAAADGSAAPTAHTAQIAVADARTLIDLTYPESRHNEYDHCVVAEYTDNVTAVPPEAMAAAAGADGGVPPEVEQMAENLARHFIQQSGTRQLSDEELQAANPLMALLQTLMPWVTVAGEAAAEAGRSEEDLLGQVPGLTEFLVANGVDVERQVPASERPRILALVREYLMMQHGGGADAA